METVSEKNEQPCTIAGVGGSYFTITTNPETAEKIKKQCEFDKKFGDTRSFRLGKIDTYKGLTSDYSVVQIVAKQGQIKPSDIFFLGLFAAAK